MSKKNRRSNEHDYDYEDDFRADRGYHDQMKERRRQKRMKNALRSNNVDDIYYTEYDDSDYHYR